ncbi:hypothetical protein [Methylomagnum sp.]
MTQPNSPKAPFFLMKSGLCALSIAIAGALMGGCDSSPSGSGGSASAPATDEANIAGNVQDIHGPLMEAKIEVRDKSGQIVATTQLTGGSNHYAIKVPAGSTYPILMTATPPEGSNSFVVKAAVTSPLAERIDITDVTTLVVDSAMTLGGLSPENIAKASGGAIGLRQRQGVSAGAGGGGAGAGQSGGGVSRGGHGGHDMSGMGGNAVPQNAPGQAPAAPAPMQNMQH